MQTYERLRVGLQSHGEYPRRTSESPEEKVLARWINNRRTEYGNGQLLQEREELLAELPGWTWGAFVGVWDGGFENLQNWLRENSNVYPRQVSEDLTEQRLGQWLHNQRKAQHQQ